jgi:hypothetical protein
MNDRLEVNHLSRIQAEQRLNNQPVGTFILREGDKLNHRITAALARENHEVLQSCILTVVEPDQKISERFVVHTPQGWTIYQDNPDLHDEQYHFYRTMNELLRSIESVAKKPLNF